MPEFVDHIEIQIDITSQLPTLVLYDTARSMRLFEIVPMMSDTIFAPQAPYTLKTLQ